MIATLPTTRRWSYPLAAAVLILGVSALRLVYLARWCPLDLAPDEAHYWDWSRDLDWSYYSKGPLVAYLIRLSCELFGSWSLALTGSEMPAVRLPAVVCGALMLAGLYQLALQVHRSERLALAVVGVALTLPIMNAGSILMTIDAPFCCAWCWALVFTQRALFGAASWAWPAAGVCVMLGVLAKHTMVLFVPCLALFLLATPTLRPLLWRPGFWMLTGIGALGGVPILVWNAQHDWVTLRHTQGHIGMQRGPGLHWLGPLNYLALQFAVLLGFWFIAWARACWNHRPGLRPQPELAFLWWLSLPVIVFFWLFSLKNGGGEPNWPIAGYLAGLVLTAGWLAEELRGRSAWASVGTGAFCVLGLALTLLMHDTTPLQPLLERWSQPGKTPLVRRLDPTCRLRGWRYLAGEVDKLRGQVGRGAVLAGSSWGLPGELGFYCAGQPTVYCLGPALGDRHSQYDVWRNPLADAADFQGKTFIVVGASDDFLRAAFAQVEPTRTIVYRENDVEINRWPVTVAHGYRGFPALPTTLRH
jgi:4-amino-4-deoxy-L-arabinose transferase-like glycosyltransferase